RVLFRSLTALSRAQTSPLACLLGREPRLHEQDLGTIPARFDRKFAFVQDLCRAALIELGLRERAVHDEEVATESAAELVTDGGRSEERRSVKGSVLVHGDRIGRRRCAVGRIPGRWN